MPFMTIDFVSGSTVMQPTFIRDQSVNTPIIIDTVIKCTLLQLMPSKSSTMQPRPIHSYIWAPGFYLAPYVMRFYIDDTCYSTKLSFFEREIMPWRLNFSNSKNEKLTSQNKTLFWSHIWKTKPSWHDLAFKAAQLRWVARTIDVKTHYIGCKVKKGAHIYEYVGRGSVVELSRGISSYLPCSSPLERGSVTCGLGQNNLATKYNSLEPTLHTNWRS